MIDEQTYALIEERSRELALWLDRESPYVQFDQRHLDAGSPHQAYWHLGYLAALRDALDLIKAENGRIPDIANSSPPVDRDE
jgi:hypothetical protein